MKLFFTTTLFFTASLLFAQPKLTSQAIITTTTVITASDNEEAPSSSAITPSGEGGGPVTIRRSFDDAGETSSMTYFKNSMIKTVIENGMGRTTTIRDHAAKKTTTLMEIMGSKRGFYATDEEQAEMRRKMDSLMQAGNGAQIAPANTPPSTDIVYTDESKKIAGYICKKALVINTRSTGKVDTTVAWYNTEIKFDGLNYTGGAGGGFLLFRNSGQQGFDKIDGFVMEYTTALSKKRTMTVTVNKLNVEKEVKDKEFEISKDFELQAMKDMQGADGRMRIQIGGPSIRSH
jgi:hypothetical protein